MVPKDSGYGPRGYGSMGSGYPTQPAPTVNRLADACENIIFPQVRLRAVINSETVTARRVDELVEKKSYAFSLSINSWSSIWQNFFVIREKKDTILGKFLKVYYELFKFCPQMSGIWSLAYDNILNCS